MPVLRVNVKWGKEKFENVDLDTDEKPLVFKTQLFTLTGVEPARQKVMTKGGVLKDDSNWKDLRIQEGHSFMLMGTPGEVIPAPPVEKTVFMEDLNERQLAAVSNSPGGLENLGNTCYMSAVVHCLRSIPELCRELRNIKISGADSGAGLTVAFSALCETLQNSKQAISPILFCQMLRTVFPLFAQQGPNNQPLQQDAEECWTQLVRVLSENLHPIRNEGTPTSDLRRNCISQLLSGEMVSSLKCQEAPEETPQVSSEIFFQLPCHISKDVNHLMQGIKERMHETIVKHSQTVGRDCEYTKTMQIHRLPAYLCVNMVRFFWKSNSQVKAKILRNVKFPLNLDLFELCTPELQAKLLPQRNLYEAKEKTLLENPSASQKPSPFDYNACQKGVVENPLHDIGCNDSGFYELRAVLTHIGRSADSGHYVAWVRNKGDDWWKYDDDQVSSVKSEDILKLSGGGDWHIAYLLLYGRKEI